jgi:hypothetical protein
VGLHHLKIRRGEGEASSHVIGTISTLARSPIIGLELYDLAADPNETSSLLHYPETGRDPVLAPRLQQLSHCAGENCRELEDTTTAL